jgi:hypothetical protein
MTIVEAFEARINGFVQGLRQSSTSQLVHIVEKQASDVRAFTPADGHEPG